MSLDLVVVLLDHWNVESSSFFLALDVCIYHYRVLNILSVVTYVLRMPYSTYLDPFILEVYHRSPVNNAVESL